MERRTLPKRDAFIIVALIHAGIVMLWFFTGGCGDQDTREIDTAGIPGTDEVEDLDTDMNTIEPPVTVTGERTPAIEGATTDLTAVRPANEVRYIVQAGDSLWKISRKFGVSVNAISERNDVRDPALIRTGRELWIPDPTKGFGEAAGTKPAIEPPIVSGTTEPVTGETTETVPGGTLTTEESVDLSTLETFDYEIQPGDTIWKLARTYRTTTKLIMDLNGITDAKTIRAGDTLKIPKAPGE